MAFCFYCDRVLNGPRVMRRKDRNKGLDFTIDHKTPLSRGGPDIRENRVPCCFRCNNLKADMTAKEFYLYIVKFGFERQPRLVRERMKQHV